MADRPQGTTQEPGRMPAAHRPSDTREQICDRGARVKSGPKRWVPRFVIGLKRREARSREGHRGHAAGRDIGVTTC